MPREYSTDFSLIASILDTATVLTLAMSDSDRPYCLPLNFVRVEHSLYLHSGTSGKKLDILAQNPHVCFSLQSDVELQSAELACKWGYAFRSVIGTGVASIVTDAAEKRAGLEALITKWAGSPQPINEKIFSNKTCILRIDISEATARVQKPRA